MILGDVVDLPTTLCFKFNVSHIVSEDFCALKAHVWNLDPMAFATVYTTTIINAHALMLMMIQLFSFWIFIGDSRIFLFYFL